MIVSLTRATLASSLAPHGLVSTLACASLVPQMCVAVAEGEVPLALAVACGNGRLEAAWEAELATWPVAIAGVYVAAVPALRLAARLYKVWAEQHPNLARLHRRAIATLFATLRHAPGPVLPCVAHGWVKDTVYALRLPTFEHQYGLITIFGVAVHAQALHLDVLDSYLGPGRGATVLRTRLACPPLAAWQAAAARLASGAAATP